MNRRAAAWIVAWCSVVGALAVIAAPSGVVAAPGSVHHVVEAGGTYPDGNDPFIFTSFSPERLQVHSGDTVEWKFSAGYNGWHSVTFRPDGLPALWRADELPGVIGIRSEWLHGHERGDLAEQCGRVGWHGSPDQDHCRLTATAFDEPGEQFSSSIFDRFFSTTVAGSFVADIDLDPGTYSYFCKYHVNMQGTLEVLPAGRPLTNPSPEELVAQREADVAEARRHLADLEGQAFDPVTRTWTVHAGATTPSGRVSILQFIPGEVGIRRGDRVHFVAGALEPHSVSFPRDGQGGFTATGDCDTDGCTTNSAPWGMTGLAYPWLCEYDDEHGGAPGVPAAFVPSRAGDPTPEAPSLAGCPSIEGRRARSEMVAGPYMAQGQPAPLDLVATPTTVHNSGIVLDAALPAEFTRRPDGSHFPSTFGARFPNAGTFTYACYAHEIMEGTIRVL